MKRVLIVVGVLVVVLIVLVVGGFRLAGLRQSAEQDLAPVAVTPPSATPPAETAVAAHPSLIYGRITSVGGDTYEGRLRWGGYEEASWGDYFNGSKDQNAWALLVPPERLPVERRSLKVLGVTIPQEDRARPLGRLFMTRFGDIARVEASLTHVLVTVKSGTVFDLDRNAASDLDDGVRVWDAKHGAVDLDARQIRSIEFLAAPQAGDEPARLHGTVRTAHGSFTGFIQWNRRDGLGADELVGRADGRITRSLRFDTVRSIERRSGDSAQVTLREGGEVLLSDTPDVGDGFLGIYVDDARYGRVLVPWNVFERVDFSPGGSGPAYGEFPTGRRLTGSVTLKDGRRLAGRLVYDLDESETTETFDAPRDGVDYTIPFGLIASIVPPRPEQGGAHAKVTLMSGEELQLEPESDVGEGNAGMLVFAEGAERPEYVPWSDIARVDFDRAETK